MGAGQVWGGSQWEGGLGWRGCIRHNCGKRFARLGDTIGEERGLRASLRSRPGVSARDPRGGVCENNRREADSRFNGERTGHYCPENICTMHKYPTLRAFMPAALHTLIIHWCPGRLCTNTTLAYHSCTRSYFNLILHEANLDPRI